MTPTPQALRDGPEPCEYAGAAMIALWWAGRGEWERAHRIVMSADTQEAAWVHAYLHRVEGDLGNAAHWYRRAGRPVAGGPLEAEWDAIAADLLSRIGGSTSSGGR